MGIESLGVQEHKLSYDKILKNTLAQSNEMTIRFINGLLGDDLSLDATVEWLDKESVSDRYTAIVADFYPRVEGRMYAIEVEQDGRSGDIAVRVFKYALGGAMLHNMTSTRAEVNVKFPTPCVVFLSSTKTAPRELSWNIEFFDGQKVSLKVPAIHLGDLSIKEISERNLLPIGQFYLRTFGAVTEKNIEDFRNMLDSLLTELRRAIGQGLVPSHIGLQMQDTIRKTMENILAGSEEKGVRIMASEVLETLPWIDYKEVFSKLEEKSKAEGKAEGIEAAQKGIALNAFSKLIRNGNQKAVNDMLRDIGIPEGIIESARKEAEAGRENRTKVRSSQER
jgi:hypothetical protein